MLKKFLILGLIFASQKTFSIEIALGKEDSPITMIEYGSLTCDHCIGFHRKILPIIKEKYIKSGKVRFIYRHYPTSKVALQAAIAVECAAENHYEVLNNFYFNIKDWYSPKNRNEAFKKHAQIKEEDTFRYDKCLENEETGKKIMADQKAAYEKYDIQGTPSFIVNGKVFKGEHSLEDLEKIIQNEK
ncbi:thioredoxin domain-containing protein [Aliikangiella coralliicola]|uniref:DsbA family protein n=1 Tax=Aliikangiella coralliicola TaxID=2592383 RepID=A0A545UDU0_9GAMM|nr:thioredoxin domain-containing protein [Aliikangiella coralliicola]TQV87583.1 DsbA family protein [Aliikangiella coralliicola]